MCYSAKARGSLDEDVLFVYSWRYQNHHICLVRKSSYKITPRYFKAHLATDLVEKKSAPILRSKRLWLLNIIASSAGPEDIASPIREPIINFRDVRSPSPRDRGRWMAASRLTVFKHYTTTHTRWNWIFQWLCARDKSKQSLPNPPVDRGHWGKGE